jgi:hypothetical protein
MKRRVRSCAGVISRNLSLDLSLRTRLAPQVDTRLRISTATHTRLTTISSSEDDPENARLMRGHKQILLFVRREFHIRPNGLFGRSDPKPNNSMIPIH